MIFSEFQFQSIGKTQTDSGNSLLKRLSSVNASGCHEYDEQDDIRSQDVNMIEESKTDASSAAFASVPPRPTLLQTLGNEQQALNMLAQPGLEADIFGQKITLSSPSTHPLNSTTSTPIQPVIAGPAVEEAQSSSSSSVSRLPSHLPPITAQITMSRAGSCTSNSSNDNLTYPFDNTISALQTPGSALSPLMIKTESSRAVLSKGDPNSSLVIQENTPLASAPIQSSSAPTFATLKETYSHFITTFISSTAKSFEAIAQTSVKLVSALESASRAQNLARESYQLAQTASSTLVDSMKVSKDSHETADKAISLVQVSMEILTAFKTNHEKDTTGMKGAIKNIGRWIKEEEERMKLAKEAREKEEKEEKEKEARQKYEKQMKEAQEIEAARVAQKEKEKREKVQEREREIQEEKAMKENRTAKAYLVGDDVISDGPASAPTSHASRTSVDAFTSSPSVTFDINEPMTTLDNLDTLAQADAWIAKLKTIETAARRAREEKENQRDRALDDQKRKEEHAEEDRRRQEAHAEQERQRLQAEQEDRKHREEKERRQKKDAAEEHRRKIHLEEEERNKRDTQKRKAAEEREQNLKAKLEQERAQARAEIEKKNQRNAFQQSEVGNRKHHVMPNTTINVSRPTSVDSKALSSGSSIPLETPASSLASTNPSILPISAQASLPPMPDYCSLIPATPNIIANQTVPKLSKNQRRALKRAELLAQQQVPLSGNVSVSRSPCPSSTHMQNGAFGVCQDPLTTQYMPLSSDPQSSTNNNNHLYSAGNNVFSPLNGSNDSSSPILHSDPTDTGNVILQASSVSSPVIQAANRWFISGAGAGSQQQSTIPDSADSTLKVSSVEGKKAARKLKPQYDIPVFKEEEDDEKDSAKYIRSIPTPTQKMSTTFITPSPSSGIPAPPTAAATITKVSPSEYGGYEHLATNSQVGAPVSSVSPSLPVHQTTAPRSKTPLDVVSVSDSVTGGHSQSRTNLSANQVPGNASEVGLGLKTSSSLAGSDVGTRPTPVAGVPKIPPLFNQPKPKPTPTPTSISALVPLSSQRTVDSATSVNLDASRQPLPAPLKSHNEPVFRGGITTSSAAMQPPSVPASESQSHRASLSTPGTSARPLPAPALLVQTQFSVRRLSPIADGDGGWANVLTPSIGSELNLRSRRGNDHWSPSPNSPGSNHTSSERSSPSPASAVLANRSPSPEADLRTQLDRRLSPAYQGDISLPRRNQRGRSASPVRRHPRTRPTPNSNRVVPRSRSPPATHAGRKRTRVDDGVRDIPPSFQDPDYHVEFTSRNVYRNSKRVLYPDSDHPVEAYTEPHPSSYSRSFYDESHTSLGSRLSNQYEASGERDYSESDSAYYINKPPFDDRRTSPPFARQPQSAQPSSKRQKHIPADTGDSPALLHRLAHQPEVDHNPGHALGRGRGRRPGHGSSNNSHSSLGQRFRQPSNDSLIHRLQ
ncbi:hypothetical protein F5050DRAFT_709606 [Lentinula boryana]|uniref:Uncharacterized protein n=1 Tax=Lentinula boryana TaxID=40481 RepID=A0ABQ8Q420_9AGAR|nr:hypothetical protein F5050DRAFT_709606 [Lentinula boryana]